MMINNSPVAIDTTPTEQAGATRRRRYHQRLLDENPRCQCGRKAEHIAAVVEGYCGSEKQALCGRCFSKRRG